MPIDYSKWDNINSDDSDDEEAKLSQDRSCKVGVCSEAKQLRGSQENMAAQREVIVRGLAGIVEFDPSNDPRSFHGRMPCLSTMQLLEPEVLWASTKKPRESSPNWLTASEYRDEPDVFAAKVRLLKDLLLCSRKTMAYTGAGLSVAAGIGMAAVGSTGGAGTGMGVSTAGEPTLAHCVMAELNRQDLLHAWVQQNHDGLPQKAGYRQEDINEIHGSWFDPSNPVVKYSGTLRDDLCADMTSQAQTADLVIVLGTSLTGLNADQCVTETASRSIRRRKKEGICARRAERGASTPTALGSVIISPQRTAQDGRATLRIFATADEVMETLSKEFDFGPRTSRKGVMQSADMFPKQSKIIVPYDKYGFRSERVKTQWDLSVGSKVRISIHNNLAGAHQPQDEGITCDTIGRVTGRDDKTCSISIDFNGKKKKLGLWWLDTALRGGVDQLPLVNVNAQEMIA